MQPLQNNQPAFTEAVSQAQAFQKEKIRLLLLPNSLRGMIGQYLDVPSKAIYVNQVAKVMRRPEIVKMAYSIGSDELVSEMLKERGGDIDRLPADLKTALSFITELDLAWCEEFNDEKLKKIVDTCPRLKKLNLSGYCGTAEGCAVLGKLSMLSELHLGSPHVNNQTIESLAHLPLEKLDLSFCEGLAANVLRPLVGHKSLRELRMCGTDIGDIDIEHASTMPHLQHFDLSGCGNVTAEGIQVLKNHKAIQILNLDATQANDETVAALASLVQLKELYLRECHNITKAVLKPFKSHPNLQKLGLSFDNVDPNSEALLDCCEIPNLQKVNLDLSSDPISDNLFLACLGKLEQEIEIIYQILGERRSYRRAEDYYQDRSRIVEHHLEEAEYDVDALPVLLRRPEVCLTITTLDLRDTDVLTDEKLARIVAMFPNIEEIDLRDCANITEKGYRAVASLKKLREVNATDVSEFFPSDNMMLFQSEISNPADFNTDDLFA